MSRGCISNDFSSMPGGNRSQLARLLDVSYPTVAKKIADYGIKLPD